MRLQVIFGALLVSTLSGAPARADQSQADKDAMMAKWQQSATPGEYHKKLEPFIGTWNHTVRWQMSPEEAPTESKGTNVNTWILGGRFLQQSTTGQALGQPFEGIGITGYDNVRQEYTSIWIDSMGTGMMQSTGQYDLQAQAINEAGTYSCPMTGNKQVASRGVWKLVDADHYTYEMYTPGPDGKEFRSMEIAYARAQ
jgi:hypothetical protein